MTPDRWILWYYRTRDSFGAPALNFVDSTGRMHAKKCIHCAHKKRASTSDGNWICGNHKCKKPWTFVDRYILCGEVQRSVRPTAFDSVNARYFDVATQLHYFLRDHPWDGKLYVANILGHSQRSLEVTFPAAFPDAPGPFGKGSVHRRIVAARATWDRRLRRAGIFVSMY